MTKNMFIEGDCDSCEQKEMCPVYTGRSCKLALNHLEELRPTPIPSEEEVEYSVSRG